MTTEVRVVLRRAPLPRGAIGDALLLPECIDVGWAHALLVDDGHADLAARLVGRLDAAAARDLAAALEGYIAGRRRAGWTIDPDERMPRGQAELLGVVAAWLRGVARVGCALWAEVDEADSPLAALPPRGTDQPITLPDEPDSRANGRAGIARPRPLRVVPPVDPAGLWDENEDGMDERPASELVTDAGHAAGREDDGAQAGTHTEAPAGGDNGADDALTGAPARIMPPWIKGGIWDS